MSITETIVDIAVQIISSLGYFGVFFLMALESMIVPVPAEAVMPFAGFLAAQGGMNLWLASLVGALGGVFGSVISYYIGLHGGYRFVNRFGKYFLIDKEHLDWTVRFFKSHGEKTIFISRFIPVVRHIISIPAGVGKMLMGKFVLYTFLGAFIYDFILTFAGFKLGQNWTMIKQYSHSIDLLVVAILVVVFAIWFYHLWKRHLYKKRF